MRGEARHILRVEEGLGPAGARALFPIAVVHHPLTKYIKEWVTH